MKGCFQASGNKPCVTESLEDEKGSGSIPVFVQLSSRNILTWGTATQTWRRMG